MNSMNPRTAFVTGATGFLGPNLVAHLPELGWTVLALHRAQSNLTYLKRFPVHLVEGSVEDAASLERALPEGADAVFHAAGDVSFWSRHNARQTRTNVDGTRNLVAVALKRGARTFVHTSTTTVYGLPCETFDATTPHVGKQSSFNYQRTKALAHDAVRNAATRPGLDPLPPTPATL